MAGHWRTSIVVVAVLAVLAAGVAAATAVSPSSAPPQSGPPPKVPPAPQPVPSAPHRGPTPPLDLSTQRTFVSGVGSDANPCTRARPCRTFQRAFSRTATGGEVVALDSSDYDPVTVDRSVSLVAPPGVEANIVASSGRAITVDGGPDDIVTIRGLTLTSLAAPGNGSSGIGYGSGGTLFVQDTTVTGFDIGLDAVPIASASISVDDSLFSHDLTAALLFEGDTKGHLHTTIDHTRFEDGANGVGVSQLSTAVLRDSVVTGFTNAGVAAFVGTSVIDVENSLVTHSVFGVAAEDRGTARVSQTTIKENSVGVFGNVLSFGNNRLSQNASDGSFSGTIPLQ